MAGDGKLAAGIPARLTPAEGRKFAFTVGAAFLAFTWWRDKQTLSTILGSLGAILTVLGIAVPGKLGPLNSAWMGLAHAISKVTTPIFMGVIYFVVLSPISFVMRAAGRNPLRAQEGVTYWRTRPEGKRRSNLLRQF
jgi:hypothetical protein